MTDEEPTTDLRRVGEHIEALLGELGAMAVPRVREAAEELVRVVTDLHGEGMARTIELAVETLESPNPERAGFVQRLVDDDLVASILMVHGLHPEGLEERVARALDEVRPDLGAHGGDVELLGVDVDDGVVHLRLLGSCDGCPSSAVTLTQAVEKAVMEAAPEVTAIEVEGLVEEESLPAAGTMPVRLTTKPGGARADPVGARR